MDMHGMPGMTEAPMMGGGMDGMDNMDSGHGMNNAMDGQDTGHNGTDHNAHNSHEPVSGYAVTAQIIGSVLVLITNAIVLIGMRKVKNISKATILFISNMAATDMILAVILMIHMILMTVRALNSSTCLLVLNLSTMVMMSTIFSILLLTLECFIAVQFPIVFKNLYSVPKSVAQILCGWAISLVFASLMHVNPRAYEIDSTHCHFGNGYFNLTYLQVYTGIIVLLMATVLLLQLITVLKMQRQKRKIASFKNEPTSMTTRAHKKKEPTSVTEISMDDDNQQQQKNKNSLQKPKSNVWSLGRKNNKSKKKVKVSAPTAPTASASTSTPTSHASKSEAKKNSAATNLIGLVVLSFFVCWGAYIIGLCIYSLCGDNCPIQGHHIFYFTIPITLNSTINTMIFMMKSRGFRKAIFDVLRCKCKG